MNSNNQIPMGLFTSTSSFVSPQQPEPEEPFKEGIGHPSGAEYVGKIVHSGPTRSELERWYEIVNDLTYDASDTEAIRDLRDEIYSYLK